MRADADFEEYVQANGARLLRFALLQTGDVATAQDVLQSVLGRALLSWQRISAGNPDAYLARAIINERTSLWRRFGRREVLSSDPPERAGGDSTDTSDARAELLCALAQLPVRQRAALVLRYFEDLPDDEIAAILECSPATVRSHVFRGLARLRPLIDIDQEPSRTERIES